MAINFFRVGGGWSHGRIGGRLDQNQKTVIIVNDKQLRFGEDFDRWAAKICKEKGVSNLNFVIVCPMAYTRFEEAKEIINGRDLGKIVFAWIDIVDNRRYEQAKTTLGLNYQDIYPGVELAEWLKNNKQTLMDCKAAFEDNIVAVSDFALENDIKDLMNHNGIRIHYTSSWQSLLESELSQILVRSTGA